MDVAPLLASLESLGADVDVRPALALLAARDYELDPERLNPRYDDGDHIHPNDAGYQVMANAIKLPMLLRVARSAA